MNNLELRNCKSGPVRRTMKNQRGVALVVALVLLVIVTLVGLAAIRGVGLQEKMAGNTFDRAQAFQVAEATLDLASRTILPPAATPNNVGYLGQSFIDCSTNPCAENPAMDAAIPILGGAPGIVQNGWTLVPTTNSAGASNPGSVVSLYSNNPSYIVQYMGSCSLSGQGSFVFTNDQNNQGGGGSLTSVGQCYRITARSSTPGAAGAPPADRSQVVLQAIYRTS